MVYLQNIFYEIYSVVSLYLPQKDRFNLNIQFTRCYNIDDTILSRNLFEEKVYLISNAKQ